MNHDLRLAYLGESYFHEDYDLEGMAAAEVVQYFARREGLQTVQFTYSELAEILAIGITEDEARSLWMDEAAAVYDPEDDGIGCVQWLRTVLLTIGDVLRQRWLISRDSLPS